MTRVVLLSDTHGRIDDSFDKFLNQCDIILHAGDYGDWSVIDRLQKFAPVKVVSGNIDSPFFRKDAPLVLRFNIEEVSFLMMHIGGYPGKYCRNARMEIAKQKPDVFVCGHSHILRIIYDKNLGMLTLNPGAMGFEGFHNVRSVICFDVDGKDIRNMRTVTLPRRLLNDNDNDINTSFFENNEDR